MSGTNNVISRLSDTQTVTKYLITKSYFGPNKSILPSLKNFTIPATDAFLYYITLDITLYALLLHFIIYIMFSIVNIK